jgi:hypothetical protein
MWPDARGEMHVQSGITLFLLGASREGSVEDWPRKVTRRDLLALDALPGRERQAMGDLIDFLTMYPEARRRIVRTLGELTAETGP